MNYNKIIVPVILFFVITIWEHVATEIEYQYKPTYFLNQLTETSRACFRYFGIIFALFCSYLEHIRTLLRLLKIEKYFDAVSKLFMGCAELGMSWVWFIFGYIDYITPFKEYSQTLTIIGTVIFIVISIY